MALGSQAARIGHVSNKKSASHEADLSKKKNLKKSKKNAN
jgi:hypothetical protein